ncbi:YceI family protein [Methylomonas albis]|uniref:YceI family protein n=1 Tax=Methylomonas albis TaxID=1854563 RepID=UPI001CAA87C3|nr:YceI family protein [Methylomonas albis]
MALILGSSLLAPFAEATEYNHIQTDASTVGFSYKQMGVAIEGQLKKFDAQFSFDSSQLAAAKAIFEMDLVSLDAGSEEANDELAKKDWFHTLAFPKGKFVSTAFRALGNNRYEVSGAMTIKGKTKDISAVFTMTPQHNTAVFDGTFTLNRADFAIGEGGWADVGVIANDVRIQFHLLADAGK